MSVVAILQTAKARIDTPEKWRQGWTSTASDNPDADCSQTAIEHASAHMAPRDYYVRRRLSGGALLALATAVGIECDLAEIWRWNDAPERTHAEVMAAFDKAIALAEQNAANKNTTASNERQS